MSRIFLLIRTPLITAVVFAVFVACLAVSVSAQRNRFGDRTPGVVFVTSQGLYYDTFVVRDPLPPHGRFQLIENGQTEFGPPPAPGLDPQRATERSGRIVRLRTVVMEEDLTVAAITKEGAAELSDIRRCFHPARRRRVEVFKSLRHLGPLKAFVSVHVFLKTGFQRSKQSFSSFS
jgi:hypothetical protein